MTHPPPAKKILINGGKKVLKMGFLIKDIYFNDSQCLNIK